MTPPPPVAPPPPASPLRPHELPAPLPADVQQRLLAGQRISLPCAHGHMVWRHWLPDAGAPSPHAPAPLVLLHGGSGSWTHWIRNIAPLLAAGHQVWAPDLPGFGDSDPPSGGDADAMLAPLAEAFARLFHGQPVDLVGFSFGGMTAGMLLAQHPSLARRLVIVGAPGMGVPAGRSYTLRGWRHLPTLHEQAQVHRHNLAVLMLHRADRIDPLALALHSANVQRDRLPRRRLSRTPVLAGSLPRVPCPVHAICGAHDVLFHPNFDILERTLARAVPDFRGLQLIQDAGHWAPYEQPAAFHAALMKTLSTSGL